MSGIKILNDPLYGFINLPRGLVLELVDHPWFQRLRRIKQLGLSHFVYPGAVHSRFHHALGVYHLMRCSLDQLKLRGHHISDEESEAAQLAALLHDVGHGPYSHVLEHSLVPLRHEHLTTMILYALNEEFNGKLSMAISIFEGTYPKQFLCQLVASQLDVDRMDYLNRDSYYSGVVEGTIGNHRLITMMDVDQGELVFEEKAGLSIENYLFSRRLMYWQVYMHKTSLAAELMLELLLKRCKELRRHEFASPSLDYFISLDKSADLKEQKALLLEHFHRIDDSDIDMFLKQCKQSEDSLTSYLATGLLSRKFFKIKKTYGPVDEQKLQHIRRQCVDLFSCESDVAEELVQECKMEFLAYDQNAAEIKIKTKTNQIIPSSGFLNLDHFCKTELKHYLIIPPEIFIDKSIE